MKRKRYLIHKSIQLKYILMSITPALIMVLFSTYFIIKSGEAKWQKQKEGVLIELTSLETTIKELERTQTASDAIEKIERAKKEIVSLQDFLDKRMAILFQEWERTGNQVVVFLFAVLVGVAMVALVFSQRIAGPMYRITKYLDMLSEDKDIPPIKLRKHDEFKEVAESLEKLRIKLLDKYEKKKS